MQLSINTQKLNTKIKEVISQDLEELNPYRDFTDEEIKKATYIYINPDDQTWQLGFEPELGLETEDYLDTWLDCSEFPILPRFPILPIFIY